MTIINIENYIQKTKLEISDLDRQRCIEDIEKLFVDDEWCKTVPPYQTWPTLLNRKEEHWILLKEKLEEKFNLQKNQRLKAWAYVSFVGKKGCLANLWHRHNTPHEFSAVFYLQNDNEFAGTMYMIEDVIVSPKVDNNTLYMFRKNTFHTPPYWDYENSKRNRIVLAIDCVG